MAKSEIGKAFVTVETGDGKRTLSTFEPKPCSVCGKNMTDVEHGTTHIASRIGIDIDGDRVKDTDEAKYMLGFYKEQLGVYAPLLEVGSPLKLEICWECWLKSMGIPVPDQQFEAVANDG